jgi:hypothetical protein
MRRFIVLSTLILVTGSTAYAWQVKPWPPPPPPDLVVSSYAVVSPPVIHCGAQTIVFNITETNTGAGPSGPYFTHHFSQGFAFCGRSRPGLAAGASATFTDSCSFNGGPCDCSPGTFPNPLFARVDATGQVAETNEANNQGPTVVKTQQCP